MLCDFGNRASTHSTNRRLVDGRGAGSTSGGCGGVVSETVRDGGDGTDSGEKHVAARPAPGTAANATYMDLGMAVRTKEGTTGDERSRGFFSSKDSKRTRTNGK